MDRSLAGLPRPVLPRALPRTLPGAGAVAGAARGALGRVWERRRVRLLLVSVLAATPVLAGGWLWLRHSSFVSVERVQVSGVHGPEAAAIEAALVDAGHHMSTLDVNSGALRVAVAPFRVVREVRASASFPHGLHIEVVEQGPVAALVAGGTRTAVAADGAVLGPALLSSSLPTLQAPAGAVSGEQVTGAALLAQLAVLGAAPPALAAHISEVLTSPRGLTVAMRNGLLVYFGDATRPHAKWLSLAQVLADSSSAGAVYVDVRLPSRPAAGLPAGAAPAGGGSGASGSSPATGEHATGSESTVGALAAGLAAHGGAGTSTAGTESGSAGAAATSTTLSETASTTPTETTSTTPSETPSGASSQGSAEAAAGAATPGG